MQRHPEVPISSRDSARELAVKDAPLAPPPIHPSRLARSASARPGSHFRMTAVIGALLLAPLIISPASAQTTPAPIARASEPRQPIAITVEAKPIPAFHLADPTRTRFGALQFRGGLSLTSKFADFGGISGIRLDAKGERFTAISDKANWFTGRIVYRRGVMTGLADVVSAPLLGEDGHELAARKWFDTEALAFDGDTAFVGIERVHQIVRFDFGVDGVGARGLPLTLPPLMRKLPSNKGLEALAIVPKDQPLAGTLVAISERALDAQGNIRGWLLSPPLTGAKPPAAAAFTVRRTEDFDISDAAFLPDGDLLLMERKFSWVSGGGIRIRRIPMASVRPGAMLDGSNLIEADLGFEIDNFEGLDVHMTPEGDTVLTLISDDNFSMLQRTLLMQFTLAEE